MKSEGRIGIFQWIISALYLFLICIPVYLLVYSSVTVVFSIIGAINFIKKTIKNAKAKFKPESTQSLP